MKIKSWQADLSLLMAAAIWGGTFIIVKKAIVDIPTFTFLTTRFAIAALSLAVLRLRRSYWTVKGIWKSGFFIGLLLFGGYGLQTVGLQYTSAAKTGFITGLSVVLVPLIVAVVDRKVPTKRTTLGIILATIGLGLLSLNGFHVAYGDFLVFLGALCFAGHIYSVAHFSESYDAITITSIQLFVVAILSGFAMLIGEMNMTIVWSNNVWWGLLLTAIPATSLAFVLQNGLQRYTTPTHTALIFATEPIFSYIFAYFLANEVLTTKYAIGAALIVIGIICAETD